MIRRSARGTSCEIVGQLQRAFADRASRGLQPGAAEKSPGRRFGSSWKGATLREVRRTRQVKVDPRRRSRGTRRAKGNRPADHVAIAASAHPQSMAETLRGRLGHPREGRIRGEDEGVPKSCEVAGSPARAKLLGSCRGVVDEPNERPPRARRRVGALPCANLAEGGGTTLRPRCS